MNLSETESALLWRIRRAERRERYWAAKESPFASVGLVLALLPTPVTGSIGWSILAVMAKMTAIVFCVAVSARPIAMAKAHRRVVDRAAGALAVLWHLKDEAFAVRRAHTPIDPRTLS